jgi:hypothetical protein
VSSDLGAPASYLILDKGAAVYTSDHVQIGKVERVLAVPDDDIFDGIIVDTDQGHRFVDAPNVDEIYERGVVLNIAGENAHVLPEPSKNPAAMEVQPEDTVEQSKLRNALHSAWDRISGNY